MKKISNVHRYFATSHPPDGKTKKNVLEKTSGYPRKFEETVARKIVPTREEHPKNPFSLALSNFSGKKNTGCEYIYS